MNDMTAETARALLREWSTNRLTESVQLRENANPEPDPNADYAIAYVAVFEPSDLARARVEVWVATDGQVGVGFETWGRVAERLGVRSTGDRFVAGHEPYPMSATSLLAILDLVATAGIAVSATVVPLLGLIETKAVVEPAALATLRSQDGRVAHWLRASARTRRSWWRQLVRFERW